jgi:hypothetical protein
VQAAILLTPVRSVVTAALETAHTEKAAMVDTPKVRAAMDKELWSFAIPIRCQPQPQLQVHLLSLYRVDIEFTRSLLLAQSHFNG